MIALQRADSHSLVRHWKQTFGFYLFTGARHSAECFYVYHLINSNLLCDFGLVACPPSARLPPLEPEYLWPRLGLLWREEGRRVLFVDPPSPEHKLWFRVCTQSMCRYLGRKERSRPVDPDTWPGLRKWGRSPERIYVCLCV